MPSELLDMLLQKQRTMMAALGISPDKQPIESAAAQEAVAGIIEEATELLKASRRWSKPWKPDTKLESTDSSIEESIDIFFMLLEFWVLMGLSSDDIFQRYYQKFIKNMIRIVEAYKESGLKFDAEKFSETLATFIDGNLSEASRGYTLTIAIYSIISDNEAYKMVPEEWLEA